MVHALYESFPRGCFSVALRNADTLLLKCVLMNLVCRELWYQRDTEYWTNENSKKWSSASVPPDHLLLDSAPNLGPLISRWKMNNFKNCWYKSVKILEVLKFLFQQLSNLSSSQRNMSGPILGELSNNRWSWGTVIHESIVNACSAGGCWWKKRLRVTRKKPVLQVPELEEIVMNMNEAAGQRVKRVFDIRDA